LPPLAVSPLCTAPFLYMTIVCIDILERILIESRKSHGQHPLSSNIVASGRLD
jgi:hypothetical protein